jgi:alpha-methylacyl-CoA racemase
MFSPKNSSSLKSLRGVRIISLALNLPGPAALMRLRALGATCVKVDPPSGDPMAQYSPAAYEAMHTDIKRLTLNLKADKDLAKLHTALARTDVLLTSFRPSALTKLGLSWPALRKRYPALSLVSIVGAPGALAEVPGHDLTYLAEAGLVTGLDLPATLYADMGGALMTSEAVLAAVLHQKLKGKGTHQEVALSDAANWLALPRTWGLTTPGAMVGGAHAGYRVYACKDGRVAVAALEPHFAAALCAEAGVTTGVAGVILNTMRSSTTNKDIADWLMTKTRKALDRLAVEKDIPLHTMPH